MRVLVTGAAGFLGSAVCRAATARDDLVLGLVRPGELRRPCPGVRYVELDWAQDPDRLVSELDELAAEAVVHCAGATPRLTTDVIDLYEANVRLVYVLLGAIEAAESDPGTVILSTAGVYGPTPPTPTSEGTPLAPASPYAWSKAVAEDVARAFARMGSARVCIARPFNLLGANEPSGSVVSDVIDQLEVAPDEEAPSMVRLREVASIRDYVDVDDAAGALLLLAERGEPGEAYNICSGDGISVAELADTILGVWGSDASLDVADPTAAGTVSIGSPEKLRALGWEATTPLRESLERVRTARLGA